MDLIWRNLRKHPPSEDCILCVRVGKNYETYLFRSYKAGWELSKNGYVISVDSIPDNAEYTIIEKL